MYFIKRGEIVILDETQNMELCVEILYENECFGEVNHFNEHQSVYGFKKCNEMV